MIGGPSCFVRPRFCPFVFFADVVIQCGGADTPAFYYQSVGSFLTCRMHVVAGTACERQICVWNLIPRPVPSRRGPGDETVVLEVLSGGRSDDGMFVRPASNGLTPAPDGFGTGSAERTTEFSDSKGKSETAERRNRSMALAAGRWDGPTWVAVTGCLTASGPPASPRSMAEREGWKRPRHGAASQGLNGVKAGRTQKEVVQRVAGRSRQSKRVESGSRAKKRRSEEAVALPAERTTLALHGCIHTAKTRLREILEKRKKL
ncbi:hypothetical protein BKA81DRAFT_380325 [Phyllosticta paracitricarpa]|uniref:Uncharacterized protein n=1 Tax=Phyllosticta citricarpa TaxID=55181 RepID=A0ABR1MF05_9PEZI